MARNGRLKAGFNLGGEAAEADGLLEESFLESGDYLSISSKLDSRCLLVGRTGAGKSAILTHLERENPEHTIRINPENLSLPYITNLQVIRFLDSLDVKLDTFWHTLWRHVLIVEILRHRYKIDSPTAKGNFLQTIREKIKTDRTKREALAYLDEFEGSFWCDADERVREITESFTQRISAESSGGLRVSPTAVSGAMSSESEKGEETRVELASRFQTIVNQSQLSRLSKMIDVLDENVLDSPHHYTYVVIDDLDREWVDERIANDLIRCLFSTVYSLQSVRHLKIVVALRTNILQELDFGGRGGGQEEKYRALIQDVRWTRATLTALLDQRAAAAGRRAGFSISTFSDFLPNSNTTMGKPIDYILDRTLLRPRDALAFANQCFAQGAGKDRLAWAEIKSAERDYSIGRVLALRDEWKGTYPGIGDVIDEFRLAPATMTRIEFQDRLDNTVLLMANPDFEGTEWMERVSAKILRSTGGVSWGEMYQSIISILYRIGLIGMSTSSSSAPTYYGDDPHYAERRTTLEGASHFHIHKMYRQGLESEVVRTDHS